MLDVAQMMNRPPPPFIVIPRDDFMALKQHKDAPAWLRFDPGSTNEPTFYDVPLMLKEKLDNFELWRTAFFGRLESIRAVMHRTDSMGRRLIPLQPLLVKSEEVDVLRKLKYYGRQVEPFDTARMQFAGDAVEVASESSIVEQCHYADRAHYSIWRNGA